MRPRRPCPLVRVVTVAAAAAIVLAGVSAVAASALDAATAAPAPSATSGSTARIAAAAAASPTASSSARIVTTTVQGWKGAPTTIATGKTFCALLLVSGSSRTVRLERLVQGSWRTLDTDRTSRNGAASVAWKVPRSAGRVVLRLHVLRTSTHTAVTARTVLSVHVAARATAPSGTPTPSTSPKPTMTPTSSAADEQVRAELLVLVNRARATARTCGSTAYPAVPALARSTALDTAAGDYARRMGEERFFAHTSPDGSTMVSRLQAVGVAGIAERENIAAGQTSAEAVMAAWLGSDGHCANLMAADVTRIGFGHATVTGSPYGQYWVQDFAG